MAVADRLKAVQVKASLIADRQIGLMEIEVDVQDGIATLTGEVTSEQEKQHAEELTYQIEGIHEVVNEIRVLPMSCEELLVCELTDAQLGYGPLEGDAGDTVFSLSDEPAPPGPGYPTSEQFPGEFTDQEVEDEVRHRLAAQDAVDVSSIQFRSVNQTVFLTGKVRSSRDMENLTDLVMNARGVMSVSSDVTVEEGDAGTPVE